MYLYPRTMHHVLFYAGFTLSLLFVGK